MHHSKKIDDQWFKTNEIRQSCNITLFSQCIKWSDVKKIKYWKGETKKVIEKTKQKILNHFDKQMLVTRKKRLKVFDISEEIYPFY